MTLAYAVLAVMFFVGVGLLLANVRVLRRPPLTERLSTYVSPTTSGVIVGPQVAVAAIIAPLADSFGRTLGRVTGIRTDLSLRLGRAGRAQSASDFRLAQFTHALTAFALTTIVVLLVRPGFLVSALVVLGVPLLVAMADEQRLDNEAKRRLHTIELELPVVAEQLGILLGAGLSLGSALDRVARRSHGVVAHDLGIVVREVRRGRSETDALREWATNTRSEGVDRLVGVLSLHRDASDLGALISTEARSLRAATHRGLVESIERRAQLVWVPVTVATLVPGLILIGVPFVSAMKQVTG